MDIRIAETVNELRNKGLSDQHKKILPSRLKSLWVTSSKSSKSEWRNQLARQAFSSVQDRSAHLCFVLILLLSATQCGQKMFCDTVITPLLELESYDAYHFSLGMNNKRYLEDTAKKERFEENANFIALMQALFPDVDRTITYGYSKMPRSNMPLFLRILAEAIEQSNLCLGERQHGDERTSAATVLIPAGDVDCACSIVVSRAVITEALGQLGLTKIFQKESAP